MTKTTIYTGGCHGADFYFTKYAIELKYKIRICSFSSHLKSIYKYYNDLIEYENLKIISYQNIKLRYADAKIINANKILKRKLYHNNEYVMNLLRRDYHTIKNCERVYAVGYIDSNGKILGGTAWACTMYIDNGGNELYFYDQNKKYWTKNLIDKKIIPPRLDTFIGRYAGIGTREISEDGIDAIKKLYFI